MKIFYTQKAAKQLKDLPHSIQKRIVEKMRFYANQENPLKFAKRLADFREGEFRFRIGDYRLIFDIEKDIIYILKIDKSHTFQRGIIPRRKNLYNTHSPPQQAAGYSGKVRDKRDKIYD